MIKLSRAVGYVFIACAIILLLGIAASLDSPALLGGYVFYCLVGSAFFFILAEIVQLLTNISNRLTWLMPQEYFDANPDVDIPPDLDHAESTSQEDQSA